MTRPLRFEGDLAALKTSAFGNRSLTWWGIIGYMLIEAAGFAMAIGAYFFLMDNEASWPPEPWRPPALLAGTLFTVLVLLSEIPNTLIKRAAEAGELARVRRLILMIAGIGVPLLVLRGFEFASLNVGWSDNAYGSIMWALLLLHTLHIATDWVDTLVLAALLQTEHGTDPRKLVDTSENALYWRFIWISWLPIYAMIYWLPRWF